MSSNMTPMEVGILFLEFSAVPDSERANFLRQNPEIRNAGAVDWALTAARLRGQVGEHEAMIRYANAALYIATEIGEHRLQVAAREILAERAASTTGERPSASDDQTTDREAGSCLSSDRAPRRIRALAVSAAELTKRPSLGTVLRVMLRHPHLIAQAVKTAVRFLAVAIRDPLAAGDKMQRMVEETLDEASLARMHELAECAGSEGDFATKERLIQLPSEMVALSSRLSSAARKAYSLQVYDLLVAVASARSEAEARRIVRSQIRLALDAEFLPTMTYVREFLSRQPGAPSELDAYMELVLDETARALSEMAPEAVGPGGAATALRLADSPQALEALLARYCDFGADALLEELTRMGVAADERGLHEFGAQTRILADLISIRLGAVEWPIDLRKEVEFMDSLVQGETALDRGRLQEALDYHLRSLAIAQATGNPLAEAYARDNLGIVYNRLNRWMEAETHLEKACDMAQRVGDRQIEALASLNLGNSYLASGAPIRALDCYDRTRHIARELDDPSLEAQALGSRGRAYERQCYFQAALSEYEQALRLQRAVGDHLGETTSLSNMANSYVGLEGFSGALLHYDEALRIARELDHADSIARILAGRAIAYTRLGRSTEACSDLEKSIEYIETTRSSLAQDEHRMSYFGWDKMGVYHNLVLLLADHDRCWNPRQALQTVERSRSRVLLDQLGYTELSAPRGIDPILLTRECELAVALRDVATREVKTEEQRQKLATHTARLQAEWNTCLDQIQKQVPEYVALRRGTPMSWERFLECLT